MIWRPRFNIFNKDDNVPAPTERRKKAARVEEDEVIVANHDVQDEDEYTILFHTTKLGLDLKYGRGRKGIVVVSKVHNEEYKHIIQLNNIVISISTKCLTPTTLLTDVFSFIGSSKQPLLIRFSRAEVEEKLNGNKDDNKDNKDDADDVAVDEDEDVTDFDILVKCPECSADLIGENIYECDTCLFFDNKSPLRQAVIDG